MDQDQQTSEIRRKQAIEALVEGTGKTEEQAEAFLDILGSAMTRRGWIDGDGEPLSEEQMKERVNTFLGVQDHE